MKKIEITLSAIIIIMTLTLKAQNVSVQIKEDEQAIKATALNYIEGWYSADTARMSKALAPDLIKRGFMINSQTNQLTMTEATYSQMVEWTGKKPNELKQNQDIELEVEIIEIGKNIAMVKTISPQFIDYIHMGKIYGEWKIYNVIWEPNYKLLKKDKK